MIETGPIKFNWFLLGPIIALIAVLMVVYAFQTNTGQPQPVAAGTEIAEIKQTRVLDDQIKLYRQLIDRVGPIQAQDDLFNSGLAFDGQTHLLNHTVGDYLYQTLGESGLTQCREYFLASCYHGFVLNAIGVGGLPEVEKILASCETQGPGVYPQCAHAVGHGFLTFAGYGNLPQALTLCDDVNANIASFPLFNCQDGIFMENIWAVHEGAPSPDRWVRESDPFYPCNDPQIQPEYRRACWSNQPSLMYQLFDGDINKVGTSCLKVPIGELQEMCFNGLARQIHPLTQGSVDKTFELCDLLPGAQVNYCINTIATAAFSVGDRELPAQICARLTGAAREECFTQMIANINYYSQGNQTVRQDWCNKISDPVWRPRCL